MSENVMEVTDEDFDEEVLNATTPVVVDFWEPSCGSCLALEPMFESLSKEFEDQVKFVKFNTEDNPEMAEKFNIRSYPTFVVFKDGDKVDEFEGEELPSKSQLRELIATHVSLDEEDSDEESSEDEYESQEILLSKETYKNLKECAEESETSVNEEIGNAFTNSYDDIEDEDLDEIDVVKESGKIYVTLPENLYLLIEEEANNNSTEVADELDLLINGYLFEDDEEEEESEDEE